MTIYYTTEDIHGVEQEEHVDVNDRANTEELIQACWNDFAGLVATNSIKTEGAFIRSIYPLPGGGIGPDEWTYTPTEKELAKAQAADEDEILAAINYRAGKIAGMQQLWDHAHGDFFEHISDYIEREIKEELVGLVELTKTLYNIRNLQNVVADRQRHLSEIWKTVCMTGNIPRYNDFSTKEEREAYLREKYDGATLKELLIIGIDPFK